MTKTTANRHRKLSFVWSFIQIAEKGTTLSKWVKMFYHLPPQAASSEARNSVGRWHKGLWWFARKCRDGTDDHDGLMVCRPPDNTRVSKGVWGAPHHCFAGALPREAGAPLQNPSACPPASGGQLAQGGFGKAFGNTRWLAISVYAPPAWFLSFLLSPRR